MLKKNQNKQTCDEGIKNERFYDREMGKGTFLPFNFCLLQLHTGLVTLQCLSGHHGNDSEQDTPPATTE